MAYRTGRLELDLSQLVEIELEKTGSEGEFLRLTLVLDDVKKPSAYYGSKNVIPYTRKSLMINLDEFKKTSVKLADAVNKDEPVKLYFKWEGGKNYEGKKLYMDPRRMINPTAEDYEDHGQPFEELFNTGDPDFYDRTDNDLYNVSEDDVDDPQYWIDL